MVAIKALEIAGKRRNHGQGGSISWTKLKYLPKLAHQNSPHALPKSLLKYEWDP